jgi:hypothetical protein
MSVILTYWRSPYPIVPPNAVAQYSRSQSDVLCERSLRTFRQRLLSAGRTTQP